MGSFESEIGEVMRADDLPGQDVDTALDEVRRRAGARRRNRTVGVVAAAAASVALAVGITTALTGGEGTDRPVGPATEPAEGGEIVPWSDRTDFAAWEPAHRDGLSATLELPETVPAGGTLEYVVTLRNDSDTDLDLSPCGGFSQTLEPAPTGDHTIPFNSGSHRLNCDGRPILAAGTSRSYAMELEVPAAVPATEGAYLMWQLYDAAPEFFAEGHLDIEGEEAEPPDAATERGHVAEGFIELAKGRSSNVPWAEEVRYFISGEEVARLSAFEAAEAANWDGCPDAGFYAGRDCPVSPVDPVVSLDDGEHVFEADVPAVFLCGVLDPPTDLDPAGVVVIRPPLDRRDCAREFAVSLYVDQQGDVIALDLVLAEP